MTIHDIANKLAIAIDQWIQEEGIDADERDRDKLVLAARDAIADDIRSRDVSIDTLQARINELESADRGPDSIAERMFHLQETIAAKDELIESMDAAARSAEQRYVDLLNLKVDGERRIGAYRKIIRELHYTLTHQPITRDQWENDAAILNAMRTLVDEIHASVIAVHKPARLTWEVLYRLNRARSAQWHADTAPWTHDQWLTALVGELGEFANILKKINRLDTGARGRENERDRGHLFDKLRLEAADIYLYLDLLMECLEIDALAVTAYKFNETSKEYGFPHRAPTPEVLAAAAEWHPVPNPYAQEIAGAIDDEGNERFMTTSAHRTGDEFAHAHVFMKGDEFTKPDGNDGHRHRLFPNHNGAPLGMSVNMGHTHDVVSPPPPEDIPDTRPWITTITSRSPFGKNHVHRFHMGDPETQPAEHDGHVHLIHYHTDGLPYIMEEQNHRHNPRHTVTQ